jgi:hypothetical protein
MSALPEPTALRAVIPALNESSAFAYRGRHEPSQSDTAGRLSR